MYIAACWHCGTFGLPCRLLQLAFVKPNFAKYTEASRSTRAIFACYDPDYESASLDEAYLDVTAYCKRMGVRGDQVRSMTGQRVLHGAAWAEGGQVPGASIKVA